MQTVLPFFSYPQQEAGLSRRHALQESLQRRLVDVYTDDIEHASSFQGLQVLETAYNNKLKTTICQLIGFAKFFEYR